MDVQSVGEFYQQLSKSNLHLLSQVYHDDVLFEDAAHRIEGFVALHKYFEALAKMLDGVILRYPKLSRPETLGFNLEDVFRAPQII